MMENTIKHFESLQKRYEKQHNGKMCEHVKTALDALKSFEKTNRDMCNRCGGREMVARCHFCSRSKREDLFVTKEDATKYYSSNDDYE